MAELAEMRKTEAEAQSKEGKGEDLTRFVNDILTEMQSKFSDMSREIVGKIDAMSGRIDDLEKQIGDLMKQAGEDGVEGSASPSGGAAGGGK